MNLKRSLEDYSRSGPPPVSSIVPLTFIQRSVEELFGVGDGQT